MPLQYLLVVVNAGLGIFGLYSQSGLKKYFLNPVNSFWLIFLYFGCVQPATNLSQYNERFGLGNVTIALLAFSFSAVFLYMGNRLSLGSQIARLVPSMLAASGARLNLISMFLLVLGVSLTLLLINAYGGWAAYFQRTNLRLLQADVSDYLTTGPRIAVFAVLIGLSTAINDHKRARATLFGLLGVALLFWFIYQGSRSSTILVVTVLFGSFYAPRMRTPSFVVTATVLLTAALTIGFIGAYRSTFSDFEYLSQGTTLHEFVSNSIGFLLRSKDTGFANVSINEDFGMAAATVAYVPAKVPFEYGYSYLQLFTQWIPHSIWPDKFYPASEVWDVFNRAADTTNYVNGAGFAAGPAPTIVGKYYYAFGMPGVIVGSFLSGVMLKVFWAYALRLPSNARAIFIIACAPIGFMEANNPTLWVTFWLPTAGVTLAIVLLVARVERARGSKTS